MTPDFDLWKPSISAISPVTKIFSKFTDCRYLFTATNPDSLFNSSVFVIQGEISAPVDSKFKLLLIFSLFDNTR